MARREILNRIERYVDPFRITQGKGFRLKDFDPGDTCGLKLDKGEASELLQRGTEWLAEEQSMLYAQDAWSLLLIFQAMDAAGKDGTIKHVMSGINPQGCQVFSFKEPSREELAHDFLWRYARRMPERGHIMPTAIQPASASISASRTAGAAPIASASSAATAVTNTRGRSGRMQRAGDITTSHHSIGRSAC